MINIRKMLENSKKPYLAKLAALEAKKKAAAEKIDAEIAKITSSLESIDMAIEALEAPMAKMVNEVPQEDEGIVVDQPEVDPFQFDKVE